MKRQEWLNAALSYLGVRFLHQGRNRHGLDCVGLVACAMRDCGITAKAAAPGGLPNYARNPDDRLFGPTCSKYLDPLPYNRLQRLDQQLKIGDIIVFWIDAVGLPRHIAIYMGRNADHQDMLLHAYAKKPHCVCLMPMDPGYWVQRIDSLWAVPGLED